MSDEVFRELLKQRAEASHLSLNPLLEEKLSAYFQLLTHWNSRINLTSLPLAPPTPQSVDRLIIEPLAAAPLVSPSVSVWFDLGSGGGSPAIPLQLARPARKLIMVESRERKAAFLRQVIREVPIDGSEVQVSRIESVAAESHNAGVADLITVRAVRLEASLITWIQTLLRFGGQAILFGADPLTSNLPRGLELMSAAGTATSGPMVLRRTGL
jgi:16S rRNA (guanine527-N7)-methyltransferase